MRARLRPFVLAAIALPGILSSTLLAQKPAWAAAPGHTTMALWPNGLPGSPQGNRQPTLPPEVDRTSATDGLIAGKRLIRLGDVSTPTLTLYAPTGKNSGAAVVVFPGGGYQILAIDLEGTEVCDWLNAAGVSCILVKYRVPDSGPFPKSAAALQDAQRALSLVRAHAAEWHIDPQRIGVLGFSAGGHLAVEASTHFDQRVYAATDAADQLSCRPDFAVLVYPAYLVRKDNNHLLDAEIHVPANTPPTFLVQAEDDSAAPVENSAVYYLALKDAKVAAEMHLYAKGGHGFGLRRTAIPATSWPQTAETWLRTIKVLPSANQ